MSHSLKVIITALGDAGAGRGYKISPNVAMQLGWRYMDVITLQFGFNLQ